MHKRIHHMKLYHVKSVDWQIDAGDIIKVYRDGIGYRVYLRKNSIDEVSVTDYVWITEDIFDVFKRDFPEHCINIEDYMECLEDIPF